MLNLMKIRPVEEELFRVGTQAGQASTEQWIVVRVICRFIGRQERRSE